MLQLFMSTVTLFVYIYMIRYNYRYFLHVRCLRKIKFKQIHFLSIHLSLSLCVFTNMFLVTTTCNANNTFIKSNVNPIFYLDCMRLRLTFQMKLII